MNFIPLSMRKFYISSKFEEFRHLILLLLFSTYWCFGFYPFIITSPIYFYKNNAHFTDKNSLFILKPGIAYTKRPPSWVSDIITNETFEIRLKFLSFNAYQDGPARIFTLSRDHYHANLMIGQTKNDIVIRVRTPYTEKNGVPGYIIRNVFHQQSPDIKKVNELIIQAKPGFLEAKLNGTEVLSTTLPLHSFVVWDPSYRIAFGNEFTFQRPWLGTIEEAVVIVGNQISHYSNENLKTPANYIKTRENLNVQSIFCTLSKTCNLNAFDIIINFFGFLPFGFILILLKFNSIFSITTVFFYSASLSLSIEFGQLFFQYRFPSISDFLFNSAGGVLGAWIASKI
ncbi:MAG: VanZ family protein [Gammaproteobacteria bacterium]